MSFRPKAFRLKLDSKLEPQAKAGTIVFSCLGWDYGVTNDDTKMTGIEHVSVTLDKDGGYPFFTMPKSALEEINLDVAERKAVP